MNCLCCGKPLLDHEIEAGWHTKCIRRFFGTKIIPEIDISDSTLEGLVVENIRKGYTIAGAQKKLSLHLSSDRNPRLTLMNYPNGYILKPQVEKYPSMPESEQLVMCMADACGIQTVPHALVKTGEELAYITKRIDRLIETGADVRMLAMEDFCQLDLRLTQDKYRGSYERCAKIIRRYSSRQGFDVSELFLRLVFSFMVGNSDMHLKNFSLIETSEANERYVLSPAYDLLPVNLILPADKEEFALTMNGKNRNIRRKDFLVFTDTIGLNRKAAEKIMHKLILMQPHFEVMIADSLLPGQLKKDFSTLLARRVKALQ